MLFVRNPDLAYSRDQTLPLQTECPQGLPKDAREASLVLPLPEALIFDHDLCEGLVSKMGIEFSHHRAFHCMERIDQSIDVSDVPRQYLLDGNARLATR